MYDTVLNSGTGFHTGVSHNSQLLGLGWFDINALCTGLTKRSMTKEALWEKSTSMVAKVTKVEFKVSKRARLSAKIYLETLVVGD